MGGAATAKFGTTRITKEEYKSFIQEIQDLATKHNLGELRIPLEYPEKSDYGDVDLLFTYDVIAKPNFIAFRDILSKDGYNLNGHLRSCAYKGHQVDLIGCMKERLDFTYFYLCYGCLGMLLGVMARQLGFKFSMDGLYLRGKENIEDIIVTSNIQEALDFLGLSYKRFQEGFNTKVELFEYIASAKYAHLLSNLEFSGNAKHRKREHQSKSYHEFFEWFTKNKNYKSICSYRSYDALLLLKHHFPEKYESVISEIKDRLFKVYVNSMETRRFDFETFAELYHQIKPQATNPEIGPHYAKFKVAISPRKEKYTHEILEAAQNFLKDIQ